jgi:hypothetical protein
VPSTRQEPELFFRYSLESTPLFPLASKKREVEFLQ